MVEMTGVNAAHIMSIAFFSDNSSVIPFDLLPYACSDVWLLLIIKYTQAYFPVRVWGHSMGCFLHTVTAESAACTLSSKMIRHTTLNVDPCSFEMITVVHKYRIF